MSTQIAICFYICPYGTTSILVISSHDRTKKCFCNSSNLIYIKSANENIIVKQNCILHLCFFAFDKRCREWRWGGEIFANFRWSRKKAKPQNLQAWVYVSICAKIPVRNYCLGIWGKSPTQKIFFDQIKRPSKARMIVRERISSQFFKLRTIFLI